MKTNTIDLIPSAQRDSHGWRAVIEFPNGGRQIFSSYHGTMDAAIKEADHGLRLRIRYPESTVRDPMPNEYQDISESNNISTQQHTKGY